MRKNAKHRDILSCLRKAKILSYSHNEFLLFVVKYFDKDILQSRKKNTQYSSNKSLLTQQNYTECPSKIN